MLDMTEFNAALDELRAQVTKTETVEASTITLIQGFAVAIDKAVTDALTADNAADAQSIAAAKAAIQEVKVRFTASEAALGAAVATVVPPVPDPPVNP